MTAQFRRLSRLPMQQQWEAAIDIAIEAVSGAAGRCNPYVVSLTKEGHWRWAHGDSARWMIPYRVERRVATLVQRATQTELMARKGACDTEHVVTRLLKWRETGHWRRVVCTIHPKTA